MNIFNHIIHSNWINSEVAKVRASQQMTNGIEGDDVGASRTPTPSSGRKKKAPSAKPAKVKPNDKPVPPFEPLDFCLQVRNRILSLLLCL